MHSKKISLVSISLFFILVLSISAQASNQENQSSISTLAANSSSQCQQDIQYVRELLKRIEGDISRGSINDFINDVYYLIEELPTVYNDCSVNNQSQELVDLLVSSFGSSVSKHCDAQATESSNVFMMGLANSLIESSTVSNEIKSQIEAILNGLKPCLRVKKAAKPTGRALQQEMSQACKQDIAWLKEILKRIVGDFERGSINDAINDVYYLIEQLPQVYNDCTAANQLREVKSYMELSLYDLLAKYCGSNSYKAESSLKRILTSVANKAEMTPELIMQTSNFATGLKECIPQK